MYLLVKVEEGMTASILREGGIVRCVGFYTKKELCRSLRTQFHPSGTKYFFGRSQLKTEIEGVELLLTLFLGTLTIALCKVTCGVASLEVGEVLFCGVNNRSADALSIEGGHV